MTAAVGDAGEAASRSHAPRRIVAADGDQPHFEQAPQWDASAGHLRGRWSALGEAAGSVGVGVHRIEVPAGAWATPAHDHAGAEELFYVLGGRGDLLA